MNTKEKIILESIDRIEKRIKEIKDIVYANPLIEIYELRQVAQTELNKHRENNTMQSEEFLLFLREASKKEKSLLKISKKQEETPRLISEMIKLESELSSLNTDLYYIKSRKK